MSDELERLKEILAEAVKLASAEERVAYVNARSGGDEAMRARVLALLRAHERAGAFLETPATPFPQTLEWTALQAEEPGEMIGRYRLLERIGEGAFGVVYMAEQQEPVRRKVALKIIKAGMDTREVIARFEAERQALALMDHPNVARVLDAGTTDGSKSEIRTGRPYFVMELVKGLPITDYCEREQLSLMERLRLFMQVCQAVQHAHQKGIIHRDLKPTNILVTVIDGKPVPKVIDFGVAKALGQKLTEKTLFTAFEQIIGTPAYMSPEQAALSGVDVDTRSDIYSLGVLLYELLTGVTPLDAETFRKAALDEIRRLIRETEPPKPSTRLRALGDKLTEVARRRQTEPAVLPRLLHGDLDWIVMKALDKDRSRRYDTAGDLAEDLQRHLDHQPVLASTPGAIYRTRKFIRRHRAGVGLSATAVAALLVGLSAAVVGFLQARHERDRAVIAEATAEAGRKEAEDQRKKALEYQKRAETSGERSRRQLYAAQMNLAYGAWEEQNLDKVLDLLSHFDPAEGEEDLRTFEWRHLWYRCHAYEFSLYGGRGSAHAAFSPDGRWVATVQWEGLVQLWDPLTGVQHHALAGHSTPIWALAFSPDGRFLATGSACSDEIILWDMQTLREFSRLSGQLVGTLSLAFSPDGKILAMGGGNYDRKDVPGVIKAWELPSGKELCVLEAHTRGVPAVAFSPDGRILASGGFDSWVRLWDTANWQQNLSWKVPERLKSYSDDIVHCLDFSPDGSVLAVGGPTSVEFRDPATGRSINTWECRENFFAVSFSPDGRLLAAAGKRGFARLYDVLEQREQAPFIGYGSWIWSVDFSPDGRELLTGERTGAGRIWKVGGVPGSGLFAGSRASGKLPLFQGRATAISVGHDRIAIATSNAVHVLSPLDSNSQSWTLTLREPPRTVALSRDGSRIAVGFDKGLVRLWNTAEDSTNAVAEFNLQGQPRISMTEFSPDARRLAIGCGTQVFIIDIERAEIERTIGGHITRVTAARFSPDGMRLATATGAWKNRQWTPGEPDDYPGRMRVWDVQTGGLKADHEGWDELLNLYALDFSPDGRLITAAGGNFFNSGRAGKVVVLDTTVTNALRQLAGHVHQASSVSYSPDGKTLATGDQGGTIRFWDTELWQQRMTVDTGLGAIQSLAFSGDGRFLAVAGQSGEVEIWPAALPGEIHQGKEALLIGQWQRATRDYEEQEALATSSNLIALSPSNSLYRGMRAGAEVGLKEYSQAIADCTEAIQFEPWNSQWWNLRGVANYRAGRLTNAISDLSEAIRLLPGSTLFRHNRAYLYAQARQWTNALADYSFCVERVPDVGRYRFGRAEIHAMLRQWPQAIEDFRLATELAEEDWGYYRLALCHLAREDMPRYRSTCERMWVARLGLEHPMDDYWRLWTACLAPGASIRSSELLRKSERIMDLGVISESRRLQLRGIAQYRAGDYRKSLESLLKALEKSQEEKGGNMSLAPAYTLFFLAMVNHQLGRAEQARTWHEKALSKTRKELADQENPPAWNRRLTLQLLRKEAKSVVNTPAPGSPPRR